MNPSFHGMRDPNDTEDVHVRIEPYCDGDGLVHRVHADFYSMTACEMQLEIVGPSKAAVDAIWEDWQTQDPVTCIECLAELDKQGSTGIEWKAEATVGMGVANVASIKKLSFDL